MEALAWGCASVPGCSPRDLANGMVSASPFEGPQQAMELVVTAVNSVKPAGRLFTFNNIELVQTAIDVIEAHRSPPRLGGGWG